ncbi:hypothetical protein PENTCL1PPCAC_12661 [Pristionchus entomophagus]|uniref:CUB domain-containing protein n=1 Tax=Pristionchus entomophagus TaxID=358040 RepID=A0AAV5TEU4_9BILA|nr:hypothetical protein PENTCL1PPCAC_12661 [Pristionchus entomophagus]
MRRLLLALWISQIAQCSCPPGFELVRDGECRGKYASIEEANKDAIKVATEKCGEIKGQPIIIHNEEHQTYWMNRALDERPPNIATAFIMIGLVCNISSKRYEWADGSSVDYRPPSDEGSAMDRDCEPRCVCDLSSKGLWDCGCSPPGVVTPHSHDLFCTTQSNQFPPLSDCESINDESSDGVCYQVGAISDSWQDAQATCQQRGGNLASIHNMQENSFNRRLAVTQGAVNGVFLGGTITGEANEFEWIDGTTWDFDNFYSGFPMRGAGDCIAMDTSTTNGQWMNVDCSSKLPNACIQTTTAPSSTCITGPYDEGAIISSPGFPFSASTPCDFFLTVEEGKKVELEMLFLEANTCCDYVTIYDGFLGGNVIANVTGEVSNAKYTTTSSNSMRVSWQPNGGVNVKGMQMTFRGV